MTFSRIQIVFVLLLFIGISNHVLIIPHLLGVAKRDAWICVLISYIILLLWGKILSSIFKRNPERVPLGDWVHSRAGKGVSNIILLLFFLYIIIIGFISFYDLVVSVKIYFLPLTPTGYLVIPFLFLCIWAATTSLKTIVYTSAFILPIVWALGHFVAITTMDKKDYSFLFPLFDTDHVSIVHGVLIVLGGSVDLLILFLLQQYFNKPVSFLFIFILITLLTGLVLGPTIGSIVAFGPNIAADLRFPAFEQWRLVELGEHISHVDALAVFQLLCGAVIRISLCFYLVGNIFKLRTVKRKWLYIISTAVVYSLVMFFHVSDIWMQTILRNYFYPFVVLFGIGITLTLLTVGYFTKRKGPQSYERQRTTDENY
ncbi:GerAB/ArcD/ProY family transporter [Alkalihalobacterium chitinilyticum]|uniref:Endospore germination permease n=1 Tax=Alkalihalobacterium chitinilyticum TaxID=2980103 RepID=A0ABT5VI07_9BACI|nr:endospore germination permease [Alkalihalobacterium chitinilyticum]MDE5415083.1 endospore germination permease [Alkalihalobacterium chitinilyticum]